MVAEDKISAYIASKMYEAGESVTVIVRSILCAWVQERGCLKGREVSERVNRRVDS